VLGLTFGTVYLGLPTITGALVGQPIMLLPIPWIDYTQTTADFLPAVATGLSFDLGQLIIGMVLPYYAMLGSFIGLMITFIANPVLYHADVLHNWDPSDNTIRTMFKNNIDFYFSFTIGVSAAIAAVGLIAVGKGLMDLRRQKAARRAAGEDESDTSYSMPEGRGDIKVRWILVTYLVTTLLYILVSCGLLYPAGRYRRPGRQHPLRQGGVVHPLGLPGRGHLVPAHSPARLRRPHRALPPVRADGDEVLVDLEE
jgi:hypothetical protein